MNPLACFETVELLITSGQPRAAKELLRQLKPQIKQLDRIETEIFVHRIAMLLLHVAETQLAGELLDWVPDEFRQDPHYRTLVQFQRGMDAARRGCCFFPLNVPPDRWWLGPHLLPNVDEDGREITEWYSGRIEFVDREVVNVHAGLAPDDPSSSPRQFRMNIPFDKFNGWVRGGSEKASSLEEGRYVEIVVYGGDRDNPYIATHPNVDIKLPLPALAFDRMRYLKRKRNEL